MPKIDFPSIPPDPNPVTGPLSPVAPPGPPGAAPMLTLFVGVMFVGLIEFVTARPASGCVCATASGSLVFPPGSAGVPGAASAWGEGRRLASNAPDCADLWRIFFCGAFCVCACVCVCVCVCVFVRVRAIARVITPACCGLICGAFLPGVLRAAVARHPCM